MQGLLVRKERASVGKRREGVVPKGQPDHKTGLDGQDRLPGLMSSWPIELQVPSPPES